MHSFWAKAQLAGHQANQCAKCGLNGCLSVSCPMIAALILICRRCLASTLSWVLPKLNASIGYAHCQFRINELPDALLAAPSPKTSAFFAQSHRFLSI